MSEEEYANKNVPTDTFGYRSLNDVHYDVRQAFLAGLKAQTKWHKVSDGDVPTEDKEYLCKVYYYESKETFNGVLHFDVKLKAFFLEEADVLSENHFDVEKWCEIPEE